MRLTAICYRHNKHLFYREFYKNRKSLKPVDLGIPKALRRAKTPIYDGYEFSRQGPKRDFSKYYDLTEKVLQPELGYIVSKNVRLTEGEVQVQLLANSLYSKEMPQSYVEQFENTVVPPSEMEWLENRLQLIKQDSQQDSLPVLYNREWPWRALIRPFGPTLERRSRQLALIFNDYVRLTSTVAPPKLTLNDLNCQYFRPLVNPHIFLGYACSGTLSSNPLPLVGDPAVKGTLPSMYPAAPEMDLRKTKEYDPRTIYPINSSVKDYNLHTIYVNHPYGKVHDAIAYSKEEKSCIALLQTFAFAAARAATSKKPLVLQTVYHDTENIDFIVMQLNTLEVSDHKENNSRNQVWHISLPMRDLEHDDTPLNPTFMKWLKVFYAR